MRLYISLMQWVRSGPKKVAKNCFLRHETSPIHVAVLMTLEVYSKPNGVDVEARSE